VPKQCTSIGIGTSSSYVSNITGAALGNGTALTSGGITINGVNVGASLSDGVSTVDSSGSALAKANAINAVAGSSGVTAEVQATTRTITASAAGGAYSLTVNGVNISGVASSSAGIAEQQQVTLTGSSTSTSTKFLGVATTVTAGDSATATATAIAAAKATIIAGAKATALGITDITASGATLTFTFRAGSTGNGLGDQALVTTELADTGVNTSNGITYGSTVEVRKGVVQTTTATAQGNASEIAAAINAAKDQTGVSAKVDGTSGDYILSAADGRNITVTTTTANAGSTGVSAGTITNYGSIKLKSSSSDGIVLGGLQATTAILGANAQTATATQVQAGGVSSLDLSTALGAQSALTILDKAIDTITNSRAAMGAYQNRLTASISNLETTSMNLQASRSRILDTDYAKETTNLAKTQIITQAATAMLAQANQSAQSVLALLK
jgi:flagellin